MDNGKIRIKRYKQAIICEAYCSDEITLTDIEWFNDSLRKKFSPPFYVIIVKSGDYSISKDAQIHLFNVNKDIAKVVFVANTQQDFQYAESARKTYLQNIGISICDSIESAYEKLAENI
jgi:hypothetical protein